MIKTLLLISVFSSILFNTAAQNAALDCGNGRYVNDIFSTVTRTTGITFGYNTSTNYHNSTTFNDTLRLDFYEPASDSVAKRPLIILAFGGSFVSGARTDMDSFCTRFARKGYVTAAIDYRLIYPDYSNIVYVYSNWSLLADAIAKASVDIKAAVRFFKHDAATANTYKIDSSKIFIGGISAGAVAALHTAYIDNIYEDTLTTAVFLNNGGIEGNTDFPAPYNLLPAHNSTGIAGVLSLAGGILDTTVVSINNPPLYSAQGDSDEVMPYNFGAAGFSAFSLYGSHPIQVRASHMGLSNRLYTIAGGNHASPVTAPYSGQIIAGASAFFDSIICASSVLPVKLASFSAQAVNCTALLRWRTAAEQQSDYYDIESSADGVHFSKTGTVKSKNRPGGADYSYSYKGLSGTAYFRLKAVDIDGSFTYSPVQQLRSACNAEIRVYPNPAREQTIITGLEAGMKVQLIHTEGQLLWMRKATGNTMPVPLINLAKGLYLVRVTNSDGAVISNTKLINK